MKDREEILKLKYRYCRAADARDHDVMIEHFTPDCQIDFYPDSELGKASSVKELRGFFITAQEPVLSSSHHISNVDIRFPSADLATSHCYLYSWQRFKGYPRSGTATGGRATKRSGSVPTRAGSSVPSSIASRASLTATPLVCASPRSWVDPCGRTPQTRVPRPK